ncbi:hypothetical protein [Cardinium endosymbiont of Philonthus spinipes]|uniref:hypothetical protein n=1 Tax=Cardinium endosymbiont of Philonthus spinipes TaxID=3077941 RepID=UPI00313E2CC9
MDTTEVARKRASKESVFPKHLQGMRPISPLFTGAFFYYGHSVEQILFFQSAEQ